MCRYSESFKKLLEICDDHYFKTCSLSLLLCKKSTSTFLQELEKLSEWLIYAAPMILTPITIGTFPKFGLIKCFVVYRY